MGLRTELQGAHQSKLWVGGGGFQVRTAARKRKREHGQCCFEVEGGRGFLNGGFFSLDAKGREGGTQLDRGDGAGSVLGGGGEVHPICPLFQDGLSWGSARVASLGDRGSVSGRHRVTREV